MPTLVTSGLGFVGIILVRALAAEIDRICAGLGFAPQHDLASRLERYLAWVRSREGMV